MLHVCKAHVVSPLPPPAQQRYQRKVYESNMVLQVWAQPAATCLRWGQLPHLSTSVCLERLTPMGSIQAAELPCWGLGSCMSHIG